MPDAVVRHAVPLPPDPPDPVLLAALEHIAEAVFVVDTAWRFVYLNDRAAALLGCPRAALLGAVIWEACPEVVGTRFETEYRRAVATGSPAAFAAPYPGTTLRSAVRAYPSPLGLVVYCGARTARTPRAVEVRPREPLLDQVVVAVIATDVAGRVTHWNAHAAALYGWSRAEALGHQIAGLTVGPRAPALEAATRARLREGLPWSGEFTARRKDGTSFPGYVTDAPVRDDAGRLRGAVGVSVDSTVRTDREAALTHRATHDRLCQNSVNMDGDRRARACSIGGGSPVRQPSIRSSAPSSGHRAPVVARIMVGEAGTFLDAGGSTDVVRRRRGRTVWPRPHFQSRALGNSAV